MQIGVRGISQWSLLMSCMMSNISRINTEILIRQNFQSVYVSSLVFEQSTIFIHMFVNSFFSSHLFLSVCVN